MLRSLVGSEMCIRDRYRSGPIQGARGNETFGYGPSPADCGVAAGERSNLHPEWGATVGLKWQGAEPAYNDRMCRISGQCSPGHAPVSSLGSMVPPEKRSSSAHFRTSSSAYGNCYSQGDVGQHQVMAKAPGYDLYARRSPCRDSYVPTSQNAGLPSAQAGYHNNVRAGTAAPVRKVGAYHGGLHSDKLASTLRKGCGYSTARHHGERGYPTSL
eukprot:TRINITY_DN36016_c0_g1_i2.p1 TRINITY_DN36016_c0_g1~~TRINITY_DN36016_c0_g1_i2.p1  ORF type:complete len:229 (-),score=47.56 TRINITY_DN36016_c0_g1_i2:289-930(-)